MAGVLPGGLGEVEAGHEQAMGVGGHAVEVADAQFVVLRARPCDAADEPVSFGMFVEAAQHGRRSTGSEGERSELGEHVGGLGAGLLEPFDRGLLGVAAALAVDDQRVVDRAGVDRRCGDLHAVDEPEARVADVEVQAARSELQLMVHRARHRRLEVVLAHRGGDQHADALRIDACGVERRLAGHRCGLVEA